MIQKKELSVLFIVQAGKKFGIGHLKRALQISTYYTKSFIWVLSDLKDTTLLTTLFSDNNYRISGANDKIVISDILQEFNSDLIISDCVYANDSITNTLNTCHIPMISLDNRKLGDCSEIYIAPLPSYKPKYANFTEIYYTPINEQFFLPPADNTSVSKILITLGGSDPYNNAERIVKALKDSHYKITVVAGPLSHYAIEESEYVTVKTNVNDLFPYIQKNDLIFCGPGTTLLESLAAKKHIIVVAHHYFQYRDLSSLPQVYTLLGNIFLTQKNIKTAIRKATSGKLTLPDNFNFQEWFLHLSDMIASRPAFCPLCRSYNKHSLFRNSEQNLFSCNNCKSSYLYNLSLPTHKENGDEIIANNSEQGQLSYKQAVLNLKEDSNRRIQIIKKILPIPKHTPYKLMDIGADHGIFVQEASHNGFSAQGVELSLFARKIALDNHNLTIIDSMDKIYENGPVNQVLTVWKKLELLENPLAYIKKLSILIPIGGMIAFRVPIVETHTTLFKGYFRITEKGGKLLAEQAGFVVAHVSKYFNEYNTPFLEFYCIKRNEP